MLLAPFACNTGCYRRLKHLKNPSLANCLLWFFSIANSAGSCKCGREGAVRQRIVGGEDSVVGSHNFVHRTPSLRSAHPTFNPSEWKISLDCRDQLFLNGRISSRWLIIITIIIIMPIIIIPIIINIIMMITIITRRMRRNSCFFEMGRYRCSLHHVSNFSAGKSPRTHPVSFGTL